MIASCSNPESGAPNASPSLPSSSASIAPVAEPPTATVPSKPPMDAGMLQVADNLAEQLLECQALSTAWLIKAGQIMNDYQRKLPHGDMTAIHHSSRLPWGQRYCQVLALLARNPSLRDPKLLQVLPSSIAALEVIAAKLDANLIQEGLRSHTLHPRLTRKTALAAAHKLRREALLKHPAHQLQ